MAKLIANRYSDALFQLAQEAGEIDELFEQVKFVLDVFKSNDEFRSVLEHPQISYSEKMNMFEEVFKGKISDLIIGFVNVILNKNREKEIVSVLEVFINKVMDYKGITVAEIESPFVLSENQINNIKNTLSKNLNKQVLVETKVEPNLIGGICIKVDGKIIDTSIKKQLQDMKNNLLNLQLASKGV